MALGRFARAKLQAYVRDGIPKALLLRASIVLSGLGIVVLLALVKPRDWHELEALLPAVHPGWLAAAVGVSLLVEVVKTFRWQVLLGVGAGQLRELFVALFTSRVLNFLTPLRAGDFWRLASSIGGDMAQPAAAGTSLVVEKVLDAALLALIGAVTLGRAMPGHRAVVALGAGVVGAALLLGLARSPRNRRRLAGWLRPLRHFTDRRAIALALATSVAGMALGVGSNLLVLHALSLPPRFTFAAEMLLAGYAVAVIPTLPGALATFEAAVAGGLVTLGLAPDLALLAALAMHVVGLATKTLGGLLALALSLRLRRGPAEALEALPALAVANGAPAVVQSRPASR